MKALRISEQLKNAVRSMLILHMCKAASVFFTSMFGPLFLATISYSCHFRMVLWRVSGVIRSNTVMQYMLGQFSTP